MEAARQFPAEATCYVVVDTGGSALEECSTAPSRTADTPGLHGTVVTS
jgi:hypothetical protein